MLLELEKRVPLDHQDDYDAFAAALDRLREGFARERALTEKELQQYVDDLFAAFENKVFPREVGGSPRLTTDLYEDVLAALRPFCVGPPLADTSSARTLPQDLQAIRDLFPSRPNGVNERIKELRSQNRHLFNVLRLPEDTSNP